MRIPISFFFFFLEFLFKFSTANCYLKTTLNRFMNSYFSFFVLLIIYWSAYHDAKFKMANKIKRCLLQDVNVRNYDTRFECLSML